ncbi:SH3 domain-containing protein [Verrucomicrobiota bacterium]
MRSFSFLMILFVFLAALNSADGVGGKVEVIADSAKIRSMPDENSEIICRVSKGDVLVVVKDGEWIGVVPPANVSMWVFAELVRDGTVAASKADVRIGPGIDYRSAGKLKKGRKVSVRGEFKDWLKIAPPENITVWISRKYARSISKPSKPAKPVAASVKKKITKKSVVSRKPQSNRSAVQAPAGRIIIDLDSPGQQHYASSGIIKPEPRNLVGDLSKETETREWFQDELVRHEGVLRPSGFVLLRPPQKYRLVKYDNRGRAITICYVSAAESKLASLVGRYLVISGKERLVQGVRYPVLDAENIVQKD